MRLRFVKIYLKKSRNEFRFGNLNIMGMVRYLVGKRTFHHLRFHQTFDVSRVDFLNSFQVIIIIIVIVIDWFFLCPT